MYVLTRSGLGDLADCAPDLGSAPNDAAKLARIKTAVECELRMPFSSSTDPGLLARRDRLRVLFRSVPVSLASGLQRELEQNSSSLARLFWGKVHRATARGLLAILCQNFFKEYELLFNPMADTFSVPLHPTMDQKQKDERLADVVSMVGDVVNAPGLLWKRVLKRLDAALDGTGSVPASLPLPTTSALRDSVHRLSKAQLDLFKVSFPNGSGGIDFKAFQACFERFANGELRDPAVAGHVGFGEPNGGNYFLFAEFAFLCVELDLDKADWLKALRAFVKTQEIFMHVYREKAPATPPPVTRPAPTSGAERRDLLPPASPTAPGFDFSFFRSIGGAVTAGFGQSTFERKMALHAKYDTMNIAALEKAARDNLQRAVRAP
ncbi:MAG: hypothetical protein ACREF9_11755 [Opitutaceae bacterium]